MRTTTSASPGCAARSSCCSAGSFALWSSVTNKIRSPFPHVTTALQSPACATCNQPSLSTASKAHEPGRRSDTPSDFIISRDNCTSNETNARDIAFSTTECATSGESRASSASTAAGSARATYSATLDPPCPSNTHKKRAYAVVVSDALRRVEGCTHCLSG